MATIDYKPKRDEEILIEIKDGEDRQSAQNRRQSGQTRRQSRTAGIGKTDDYLPRRAKTGAIRFFDMLRPVEDPEIFASFIPTITRPADSLILDIPAINEAQAETLAGEFTGPALATDAEDWPTAFERIRKGEIYEKGVSASYTIDGDAIAGDLSTLDEWTEAGLRLPAEAVASLELTGSFLFDCTIDFADLSPFRITDEPTIDAPAVEFAPSPTMDLFLFPEIVYWSGLTNYFNGEHTFIDNGTPVSDFVQFQDYLGPVYSVIPRSATAGIFGAFDQAGYAYTYALWSAIRNLPDAYFLRGKLDFREYAPYPYFATWFDESPSAFPFGVLYTPTGLNENLPTLNDLYFGASFAYGIIFDRLSLAIRKAGRTFYFWRLAV